MISRLARCTDAAGGFPALIVNAAAATAANIVSLQIADRLNAAGVPCNLVTGQEVRLARGARHTACTVEMADVEQRVEVSLRCIVFCCVLYGFEVAVGTGDVLLPYRCHVAKVRCCKNQDMPLMPPAATCTPCVVETQVLQQVNILSLSHIQCMFSLTISLPVTTATNRPLLAYCLLQVAMLDKVQMVADKIQSTCSTNHIQIHLTAATHTFIQHLSGYTCCRLQCWMRCR